MFPLLLGATFPFNNFQEGGLTLAGPGGTMAVSKLQDIQGRIQDLSKEAGGVHLRSTSKKGGPGGGPILGPMLKSLHSGPKRGVRNPWPPS